MLSPVADPDLQKGGGGEGGRSHPDPEIRGEPGLPKNFLGVIQASVWSKNKGGLRDYAWL